MAWIKFEKDLETDPRVIRIARALAARWRLAEQPAPGVESCNAVALPSVTLVCGALVRMWSLADTHLREGDILDLGAGDIDDLVGIPGFCSMLPADWLEAVDDHTVKLPDFHVHNGTDAKRKAVTQKRVERFRHGNAGALHRVTQGALPDQTRPRPRPRPEVKPKPVVGPGPDAPPPEKPNGKGNGHALNAEAERVLDYLNRAAGRAFQFRNPKGELTPNAEVIIARLKEDYTGEQLREVVLLKAEQWRGDEKMAEFLRPETLFGKKKFATYFGELESA